MRFPSLDSVFFMLYLTAGTLFFGRTFFHVFLSRFSTFIDGGKGEKISAMMEMFVRKREKFKKWKEILCFVSSRSKENMDKNLRDVYKY